MKDIRVETYGGTGLFETGIRTQMEAGYKLHSWQYIRQPAESKVPSFIVAVFMEDKR